MKHPERLSISDLELNTDQLLSATHEMKIVGGENGEAAEERPEIE